MDLSVNKTKNDFLKNKTILLSTWGCGDKDHFHRRDWIPLFKKMFGKLIVFTPRDYHYRYGKKALNTEFLRIIQKEKPDYLLFGPSFFGQFSIETLVKIKELSPLTKTIMEFGDDDWRFEDWSRYYALFFDYVLTLMKDISIYKKDKIKRVFFIHGINPDFFKPMNLEKKYDVTFIGRPVADRYDYIKFLKEKGINIKLFGIAWNNYPDLSGIYQKILYDEEFPRVINQSKININFSKTPYNKGSQGQLKMRVLEVTACKSFLLNEYTDKNLDFINDKKEINFKNKEELLEKIKYYLKHEDEREKIAKETYNHIVKNYSWEFLFTNFFNELEKDKIRKLNLPEINKKIITLSDKELILPAEEIEKKLKDFDYVTFSKEKNKSLEYRNYLQAYSLQITKKQISCCDYYVFSKGLGDYLVSMTKEAFNSLSEEDFCKFLNVNQIMVTKSYFLENFNVFKKLLSGKKIKLINEENTAFVSIPLVKFKEIPSMNYKSMNKVFHMNFIDDLASIFFQKKIITPYIFSFFLAFIKNDFIRKYLINYLKDIKALSNIMKTLK